MARSGRPHLTAACGATLATILCFAAWPSALPAQTARDSAALQARTEAYVHVWNTHDGRALSAFFTEDADFVMGNLPAVSGRRQIGDWWREYFRRQEPGRQLTLDVSPVSFLTPDVAVMTVGTTTGGQDDQGGPLRARKFRGTWLWHRQDSAWCIAAMRGLPTEADQVILHDSREAAEAFRPGLRAFVAAYEDAFNAHDPAALSALYRPDAEILIRNLPPIRGRDAIRRWWRTYFGDPRPYRALMIVDQIRMIAPDVALLNVIGTGALPQAAARLVPVRYARGTWVLARQAGEWRLAALWVLPGLDDDIVRASPRED